ncbi:SIR2 family protein [Kitasatospora sp. NPDC059646]|uniref:SIR2 family protein n=1 Tax=Kitasatospora sp. NPDC059646 TaxID=3346893 RepID=UPI0036C94CA6
MDPKLALALNVHASPGVYALLLGSGISMASGVKTGWGIVADLIARVATAHEPDTPEAGAQASADPEGWWAKNFTTPLGYSSLLEEVAPTPSARQALLDRYFVPEDGEEATDKAPTAAHRAIARMVKRGSFRVILTTNFDRLMERALEEVGISPQVVSRPEQIDAIKPLPHSQITIIKLHGDYADLEQRNTVTELDSYPEAQQELLKRVLDEYGLIVCGWSADWDKALVRAVEGTRSRRYPLFWSTYGALGAEAKRLTTQHSAVVLQGMSADELFTDLAKRLEALDQLSAPPISRDMAVAQLKKALPDPVKRIELNDLVMQSAFSVVSASTRERHPLTGPVFAESVQRYRADSDTLLHLLANGVFHDDGTHDELWVRALDRLARIRNSFAGSFNDALEGLRHYPSLLATWTIGLAAVLTRREELLATIMTRPAWTTFFGRTEQQPPAIYLHPWRVIPGDLKEVCPPTPGNRWAYPQSHLLRQEIREPLRLVEPDDNAYQAACNRFEFLASMIAIDAVSEEWRREPWPGEFLLGDNWGYEQGLAGAIQQEITPAWPLLQAGAFGGDPERATAAYNQLVQWKQQHHRGF